MAGQPTIHNRRQTRQQAPVAERPSVLPPGNRQGDRHAHAELPSSAAASTHADLSALLASDAHCHRRNCRWPRADSARLRFVQNRSDAGSACFLATRYGKTASAARCNGLRRPPLRLSSSFRSARPPLRSDIETPSSFCRFLFRSRSCSCAWCFSDNRRRHSASSLPLRPRAKGRR